MHRIDTVTAQKDKFGAGKNGFTRGNPQTGVPATDLDDDYFDTLQEELAAIVEAAGDSLNKASRNQVLKAAQKLFAPANATISALAVLVGAANKLPYFTGPNAATTTDLTSVGRQIIAQATASAVLEYLGGLSTTGTAAAAKKLETARNINGVPFDGTADITIPVGIGQAWSDMTGSRAVGTTYTNTTGKTIAVSAYINSTFAPSLVQIFGNVSSFTVNTMAVGGGTGDVTKIVSCFFLVPPGATYSISTNPAAVTIARWSELR